MCDIVCRLVECQPVYHLMLAKMSIHKLRATIHDGKRRKPFKPHEPLGEGPAPGIPTFSAFPLSNYSDGIYTV